MQVFLFHTGGGRGGVTADPWGPWRSRAAERLTEPQAAVCPPVSAAVAPRTLGPCQPALALFHAPPCPLPFFTPLDTSVPRTLGITACGRRPAPTATSGPACRGPAPPPVGSPHCGAARCPAPTPGGVLWAPTCLPPRARPLPVGFSGRFCWRACPPNVCVGSVSSEETGGRLWLGTRCLCACACPAQCLGPAIPGNLPSALPGCAPVSGTPGWFRDRPGKGLDPCPGTEEAGPGMDPLRAPAPLRSQ